MTTDTFRELALSMPESFEAKKKKKTSLEER